ncbi:hypothetical protein DFS34DRAFT_593594 [Phlyctochytrium arcticum]|nr:hypothetical protein DFS34DRAFT_593594 [Phlyctochytrium arcticum]
MSTNPPQASAVHLPSMQHPFAPFFMTGRFVDALLEVTHPTGKYADTLCIAGSGWGPPAEMERRESNESQVTIVFESDDEEETGDTAAERRRQMRDKGAISLVPVHRIVLAAKSRVLEQLLEEKAAGREVWPPAPTAVLLTRGQNLAESPSTSDGDSSRSSSSASSPAPSLPIPTRKRVPVPRAGTSIAVYRLNATTPCSALRLLLEWCYFSSLTSASLDAYSCWPLRHLAKTLQVTDLLDYVENWIWDRLDEGKLGTTYTDEEWGHVVIGLVREMEIGGQGEERVRKVVDAAVAASAQLAKDAASSSDDTMGSSERQVATYRYLRKLVADSATPFPPDLLAKMFGPFVDFTQFGMEELCEAHADPLLPRDVLAGALMRVLVRMKSGEGDALGVGAGKDMAPPLIATTQKPTSSGESPPSEGIKSKIDSPTPASVLPMTSTTTTPTTTMSTSKESTPTELPISAMLARLRQSSLDCIHVQGSGSRPTTPGRSPMRSPMRSPAKTAGQLNESKLSNYFEAQDYLSVPPAMRSMGLIEHEGPDERQQGTRGESHTSCKMGAITPASAHVKEDDYDLDEKTVTLATASLSSRPAMNARTLSEPNITHTAPKIPTASASTSDLLAEGPSFSDEGPLRALREVREQVETLRGMRKAKVRGAVQNTFLDSLKESSARMARGRLPDFVSPLRDNNPQQHQQPKNVDGITDASNQREPSDLLPVLPPPIQALIDHTQDRPSTPVVLDAVRQRLEGLADFGTNSDSTPTTTTTGTPSPPADRNQHGGGDGDTKVASSSSSVLVPLSDVPNGLVTRRNCLKQSWTVNDEPYPPGYFLSPGRKSPDDGGSYSASEETENIRPLPNAKSLLSVPVSSNVHASCLSPRARPKGGRRPPSPPPHHDHPLPNLPPPPAQPKKHISFASLPTFISPPPPDSPSESICSSMFSGGTESVVSSSLDERDWPNVALTSSHLVPATPGLLLGLSPQPSSHFSPHPTSPPTPPTDFTFLSLPPAPRHTTSFLNSSLRTTTAAPAPNPKESISPGGTITPATLTRLSQPSHLGTGTGGGGFRRLGMKLQGAGSIAQSGQGGDWNGAFGRGKKKRKSIMDLFK